MNAKQTSVPAPHETPNQFALLGTRRFLPLFLTQFLGAFNDNLFKNAMLVMITFFGLSFAGQNAQTLVNLAAGVFILPFFLFSAIAGQLAEMYDKARLAQMIKLLEIGIMLLAGAGFILHEAGILMVCLFLLGVHSALFGPLKYSILPQYLGEHELLGGNGMVEMGTFIAILLGQIGGTLLVEHAGSNGWLIASICVGVAILGFATSLTMPKAPSLAKDVKIAPLSGTWTIIKHASNNPTVFNSLMGISWFWFFGAVFLTQLPVLSRDILGGNPEVYTLMMAIFSIGIGLGSVLCEKMSGHKVEIGLVPFGSIGLTLFAADIMFAVPAHPIAGLTIHQVFEHASVIRVMFDLAMIGLFGGFFIVPLYALIQIESEPENRSRIIAANNILNSLFMVVAAGFSGLLLSQGISIPVLFMVIAVLNAVVCIYIFRLIPEFLMRFLVWIMTSLMYRIRLSNIEHIPDEGPCVLVCNHISFMDALIVAGSIRRPVRFVMDHRIFKVPVLNFIFKTAGAIPIASAKEDPAMKAKAFDRIAEYLQQGEVVCIFPEGQITRNGEMNPFRSGVEEIVNRTPVPVIPMALRGLWGSFFSRKDGEAMLKLPRRFRARIELVIGESVAADAVTAVSLEQTVRQMRGDWR
ncbi:MFS transporter [Burkholderiaceae bacterium DAT-1]|nr:MFS transporter [Burkholderiaceae bacterium DAT-1]